VCVKPTDVAGPVIARSEIDIAASQRDVWTVLADIEGWPTWNPALRHAVSEGDLEVSTRFRYATGLGTMSCILRQVDAPHWLAWSGRSLTIGHQQAWHIEPRDRGCHITADASTTGLTARVLKGRVIRRLQGELDAWTQLLKLEAETRSGAEADRGERSP